MVRTVEVSHWHEELASETLISARSYCVYLGTKPGSDEDVLLAADTKDAMHQKSLAALHVCRQAVHTQSTRTYGRESLTRRAPCCE